MPDADNATPSEALPSKDRRVTFTIVLPRNIQVVMLARRKLTRDVEPAFRHLRQPLGRDDHRRARLIDQHAVRLIDDGDMQSARSRSPPRVSPNSDAALCRASPRDAAVAIRSFR